MKAKSFRYTWLILATAAIFATGCKKDEEEKPVTADFSIEPADVFTGDTVHFLNESENASFYQWDFGDGNISVEENPTHVFLEEGGYDVNLVSIGTNDSDSITREVNVERSYEITIYEGIGIEGADIHESWESAQSAFATDTAYYVNYISDFELYYHEVFYYEEGVALIFYTDSDSLALQDSIMFMIIVDPYEGGTTAGITLGNSMQKVRIIYGEPENTIEDQDLLGYWYDSKGVDFWSYGTGLVEEIDIYDPADFAKKSAPVHKVVREYVRKRRSQGTFR